MQLYPKTVTGTPFSMASFEERGKSLPAPTVSSDMAEAMPAAHHASGKLTGWRGVFSKLGQLTSATTRRDMNAQMGEEWMGFLASVVKNEFASQMFQAFSGMMHGAIKNYNESRQHGKVAPAAPLTAGLVTDLLMARSASPGPMLGR